MQQYLPSTRSLLCFDAIARTGSVTRASESLNMTQSAVSRQLHTLEELLGVRLFLRARQRLWLTEPGTAYAEQVAGILHNLAQATRNIQQARPQHLRVGIEPALASCWLIPQLNQFRCTHSHINIELVTDTDKLHADRFSFDLAIVYGENRWRGAQLVRLMEETLVAVCRADLLQQGPQMETFSDALNYPIVHHSGPYSTSVNWLEHAGLSKREIDQLPGPRLETFNLVLQCATQGLGVAFLPTYFVAEPLASGTLVEAGPLKLPCRQYYNLVLPAQHTTSPATQAFADWLQALAAPEGPAAPDV